MLEIREMRMEDLDQVADIEKATFSVPWSRQGFAASLMLPSTLYLSAFVDGKLAGYCGLLQVLNEGEVTNVAVKDGYREKKVGRVMLRELLDGGEKRGITYFVLEVRKSNQAAIHLYETTGFERVGSRKNFYDKPTEDAVIMSRQS